MPDKPDALTAAKAPPAPVQLGIRALSLGEAKILAETFARSGLVPKDYRGHPEDVLVAMQCGSEIGLAPMQAVQSIAVIGGRPTVYGDGLLAVILASPLYVRHEEYYEVPSRTPPPVLPIRRDALDAADLANDDTRAVCVFWRRGQPTPTIRTFAIAQAKRAGLWGKDGPWRLFPDRMLRMRARSWAARDTFADVLKGLEIAEAIDDPPPPAEPRRVPRLSDPHDFIERTNLTRHATGKRRSCSGAPCTARASSRLRRSPSPSPRRAPGTPRARTPCARGRNVLDAYHRHRRTGGHFPC